MPRLERAPVAAIESPLLRENPLPHQLADEVRACLLKALAYFGYSAGDKNDAFDLSDTETLAAAWYGVDANSRPFMAATLRKWSYLDRMENAIDALIKAIEAKPDMPMQRISAIANDAMNSGSPLSQKQKGIVTKGARIYTTRRQQVRAYRYHNFWSGSPCGKTISGATAYEEVRNFLADIGMAELDARKVVLDLSHPLVTIIEVAEDEIEKAYAITSKQNDPNFTEREPKVQIAGFLHNGKKVQPALLNSVCFVKESLDPAEKRITRQHEIMHALFAILLNSDDYNLKAFDVYTQGRKAFGVKSNAVEAVHRLGRLGTIHYTHISGKPEDHTKNLGERLLVLLNLLKHLKDECAAYLWGGEFTDEAERLLGDSLAKVKEKIGDEQLFYYLERQFKALTEELLNLQYLGYDAKKLALKILTSQSINEAIARLKVLG